MSKQKKMNVAPEAVAKAAALANAVSEEMLARLAWMTLQPRAVVDVGCGVGHGTQQLQARYPAAQIVALDVDHPSLKYAKQQAKKPLGHAAHFICADAQALPFAAHSIDLLFANLVLPWAADTEKMLREWRRVLRPDGLLLFASLGPDTLQAWRAQLGDFTLANFIDMHEIGDMLTRARFSDPVLDVDYYTLTYPDLSMLHAELQVSGILVADHRLDMSAKTAEQQTQEGRWATTYEVVYGHAWGPAVDVDHIADEFGTVKVPLAHLRRR